MGLFSKKADPIASREKALSKELAALQLEIRQLQARSEKPAPEKETEPPPPQAQIISQPFPKPPERHAEPAGAMHGWRTPPREPIFESVEQAPPVGEAQDSRGHFNDLGVRKYDIAAAWKRVRRFWRGPAAHNPKLVSYLAAGSIRGLRPLRYEKRVARNRFIALTVFFLLILLALIGLFRP